jgi:hypothetical protein
MSGAGTDLQQMIGQDGSVIYGSKKDFRGMAEMVVEQGKAIVVSDLLTEDNLREFCRVTAEGMKKGRRTEYLTFFKITGLADARSELIVNFINSTGARSAEEIHAAVQMVKSSEGATVGDTIDTLTETLAQLLNIEPHKRDFAVRRLGGIVPVPERVV